MRYVADAVYSQNATQLQDLLAQGASTRKTGGPSRSKCDNGMTLKCHVAHTELAFVAMCLSAAYGHHEMVEVIGHSGITT